MIVRRFADGAVVSVAPDETLAIAYARMRLYDVSQLPVLDERKIVGILDESDLLLAAIADVGGVSTARVASYMTTRLEDGLAARRRSTDAVADLRRRARGDRGRRASGFTA